MAANKSILNFIGKTRVVEGSMGHGAVVIADDGNLGETPLCSVSVPFQKQGFNMQLAELISDFMNSK